MEEVKHPAVYEDQQVWVEDKAAYDETIHHDATGHYETVTIVDQEAWDEEVLVTPEQGHYETVTVVDREAYDEDVLVTPEQGHYEKKLIRDAWVETIGHDAEYRDVWVVDTAEWVETVTDGKKCTGCGLIQK